MGRGRVGMSLLDCQAADKHEGGKPKKEKSSFTPYRASDDWSLDKDIPSSRNRLTVSGAPTAYFLSGVFLSLSGGLRSMSRRSFGFSLGMGLTGSSLARPGKISA